MVLMTFDKQSNGRRIETLGVHCTQRRTAVIPDECTTSPYWLSSVSRRPARRRYYTLASKSRVDETLFGPAHREVDHGTRCLGTAERWLDEKIRLDRRKQSHIPHITKDLIRDIM